MLTYSDFSEGDPVWVVHKFSHQRGPDGVVKRITESGQIILADGRRFTPRAEGYAKDCCTLLFPAGRHEESIGKIGVQMQMKALGGLEALSVLMLEQIADVLEVDRQRKN